jgi:DNA-binding beta-propeller fold protein YncE
VGTAPWDLTVDEHSGHVVVVDAPLYPRRSGSVSVLDPRTGAPLGTVGVRGQRGGVAVDGRRGRVFVTDPGSGRVIALDARSGARLWTAPAGTSPDAVAVQEGSGVVFVASARDGQLSVLDGRTGALLRTVSLGTPSDALGTDLGLSAVAVDERHERVLVLEGNDADVAVLDARSGDLLRTIPVGVHPLAVALDDGRDRAYVLCYGGLAPPSEMWWGRALGRLGRWLPWLAAWEPARTGGAASVSALDLGRL